MGVCGQVARDRGGMKLIGGHDGKSPSTGVIRKLTELGRAFLADQYSIVPIT